MTLNSHIQNILKNSKKDTEWKKEAEERLQARTESKKSGLIATRLAIYMAENGISQTALGKMTGVSPQQISKVLKGRENLTLATIEKIENALGIQLIQVNVLEEAEIKRSKEYALSEAIEKAEQRIKTLLELKSKHEPSFISVLRLKRNPISKPITYESMHFQGITMPLEQKGVVHIGAAAKIYEVFDEPCPLSMVAEPPGEYSKFSLEDHG